MDRVDVAEAAQRLGITTEAIRQRIRRGTIPYDKEESGRYYVYLQEDNGQHNDVHNTVHKALLERVEKENEFLREELRRKDAILLRMAEGLKELEAPREARGSPESAARGQPDTQVGEEERPSSWLRRFFGF